MRIILEAEASGDSKASLGIAVYLHRLCAGIAAMTASMNGLDALVFTGGVGQSAPPIRLRTAAGLSFPGIGVDEVANSSIHLDREITASAAPVRSCVIEAREDIRIARAATALLTSHDPSHTIQQSSR